MKALNPRREPDIAAKFEHQKLGNLGGRGRSIKLGPNILCCTKKA